MKSTLTDPFPESKLALKFGKVVPHHLSDDGAIFIDRNFKMFSMVIDYLRNNGKVQHFEDLQLKDQFFAELRYWDLMPDELVTQDLVDKSPNLKCIV